MSWLVLLGIVVLLASIVALTRSQPEGARPVAGTRMMGAARTVLVLVVLVLAAIALRGWIAG